MILRLQDIPETELLLGSAMKSDSWALKAETVSEIDAHLSDYGFSKGSADGSVFAFQNSKEYE